MLWQNNEEYKKVFFITCGFYVLGICVYGTFATGKLQKWAVEQSTDEESDSVERPRRS